MTLRIESHISSTEFATPPADSSQSRIRSRRKSSWTSRWAAPLALFLIGCLALGYYAYDILDAHFFQDDQSRQFDQALQDAHASNAAATTPTRTPTEDLRAEALADLKARGAAPTIASSTVAMPNPDASSATTNASVSSGATLGRIEIPSLSLTAMIQEGTGARTLQRGVGHITGTAPIGNSGNVGLAAHRDTFFRKLRDIHQGDAITLTTLTGKFQYRVDLISIVDPENSSVLRNSTENILTLVTCYPFSYIGPAPKRFIVRAAQLPPS